MARVLSASGYSEPELEQILRWEVGPVLLPNLFSVAGEWAGFDLQWLETEILRRERTVVGSDGGPDSSSPGGARVSTRRASACS